MIWAQTIVIDPGHGYCADCTQNCTSNIRSNTEILTAMAVGDKLSALLQNCPTVTSYLTRTSSACGDFPSLSQRAAMSNSWSADRFLSIHCNAGGGTGTESFWCDNSASSNLECETFATEIQTQMVTYGSWNNRRVVEDQSYLGFHLGVLSPTNAVGCLSEIGFVDSADAVKLLDNNWRDQFAFAYYVSLQNDLALTTCTPVLNCSTAIALSCDTLYQGASSTATSIVDSYACNSWTETGPERIHSIVPTSNGVLTATLSNYTGDLDVYILGSCDPNDCLGTVSSSSATYANAQAGQTYYIIVDADDGSGSAYDLVVTCPVEDVFITNTSLDEIAIAPGYSFIATSTQNYLGSSSNVAPVNLQYFLSTDCNLDATDLLMDDSYFSLIDANNTSDIINQNLSVPATTTPGQYYVILVADGSMVVSENDETNNQACLAITVTAPVLDCSNAVVLTCGTVYSGANSNVNSHIDSYSCNTWTEAGPERVHSITPTASGPLTATVSNYTGDLDVYILGSCDPQDCLGTVASSSATYVNAQAGLTYYIVVDADDGSGSSYDLLVDCSSAQPIVLQPKVFLQGALLNPFTGEEHLMRDDLRAGNFLPTISPYVDSITCAASVFNLGGSTGTGEVSDDIVDWVWVELRAANDNTNVLDAKSALIQRDGDIVNIDGLSNLQFDLVPEDYFISIKHRNHLSVMTNTAIPLSSTAVTIDFTDSLNPISYGLQAQANLAMPSGVLALWAGNVNGDIYIKYQGATNDTNQIKDQILAEPGNSANSNLHTFMAYNPADVDMDAQIRYQGSGNDSNRIKDIILAHPDNLGNPSNLFQIKERLPEHN